MTRALTRRAALAGLASTATTTALAAPPDVSIRPRARPRGLGAPGLGAIVERAALGGAVSFAVFDATDGRLLESRAARLPQPPASTAKAITAAFAHARLGGGHRFETRLACTGAVADGTLSGDVILVGGGDPLFDTPALARLAGALPERGITRVEGGLATYAGALPFVPKVDPDQADHLGYNPAVAGLNLNFNRVHFSWRRTGGRYVVELDARGGPYAPKITSARMLVSPRSGPVYTYRSDGGVDEWTVARGALGNAGSRWLPVRNPEAYAGDVLRTLASRSGALVPESISAEDPEGETIASHRSEPLTEIIRGMLLYSTNITAEALGLAASGAASLPASAAAMSSWAGSLGMRGAAFVDHSGLNEENRVTAGDMAGAMVLMTPAHPVARRFKRFGMRDGQGRPAPDHPVRVDAKTGTLNFVSGLSGFAAGPGDRPLAFAIFCSDLPRRAAAAARGEERPDGARAWNRRAKTLQQALIERWVALYG